VTAVGATQGFPETVAPFSAGGFSNTFHRPAYQEAAVTGFLSTIPADFPGVFSKEGRAYPDVAMQGVNYLNFDGGALSPVSGTSASAPAFASLIALLNAQLVSNGYAPLGFLNRASLCSGRACVKH
jgi:tripeptidyl-peptidase-1